MSAEYFRYAFIAVDMVKNMCDFCIFWIYWDSFVVLRFKILSYKNNL